MRILLLMLVFGVAIMPPARSSAQPVPGYPPPPPPSHYPRYHRHWHHHHHHKLPPPPPRRDHRPHLS